MGITMKPKTTLGACGAGFLAGLLLAITGGSMVHSADAGDWRTDSAHGWGRRLPVIGILLILAAIATVAGWVIKETAEFSAEQKRRYEAWQQTLTPEQRAAVQAAEIAALWIGAGALHHYMYAKHRAISQRLSQQATYGAWSQDSNGIWHRNIY
jgi:hypothetical protein